MGDYEAFLNYRERQKLASVVPKAENTPARAKSEKAKPKGGTKNIAKKVAVLEREIAQLEERITTLDTEMAACGADAGRLMELMHTREQTEADLIDKMAQWETLAEQIE